jgi:hypothetical protein
MTMALKTFSQIIHIAGVGGFGLPCCSAPVGQ